MKSIAIGLLIVTASTTAGHEPTLLQPAVLQAQTAMPTQVVDPGDFTYVQGATPFPWIATAKYRGAGDAQFDPDFPAAARDIVRFCDHCTYVDVEIQPELGTHLLTVRDLQSGVRVVARVELKHIVNVVDSTPGAPVLRMDSVTVLTGLTKPGDVSYLVITASNRAAFMFKSNDMITFTVPWKFDAEKEAEHALGHPQARWKRTEDESEAPDSLGRDSVRAGGSREHLSGPWLTCAEGCCSTTPM